MKVGDQKGQNYVNVSIPINQQIRNQLNYSHVHVTNMQSYHHFVSEMPLGFQIRVG